MMQASIVDTWTTHSCAGDQVVIRYDSGQGPVTALAMTPEDCFLAGTASGALVAFAPDPRRRITRRLAMADARPGSQLLHAASSASMSTVAAAPLPEVKT